MDESRLLLVNTELAISSRASGETDCRELEGTGIAPVAATELSAAEADRDYRILFPESHG